MFNRVPASRDYLASSGGALHPPISIAQFPPVLDHTYGKNDGAIRSSVFPFDGVSWQSGNASGGSTLFGFGRKTVNDRLNMLPSNPISSIFLDGTLREPSLG